MALMDKHALAISLAGNSASDSRQHFRAQLNTKN